MTKNTMTLEQVRDELRCFYNTSIRAACPSLEAWADAIDAHLSRPVIGSDEDAAFRAWFNGEQGKPYDGMWCFARAAWMKRAALEADHAGRGVGVPPAIEPVTIQDELYADGWNACREAMLARTQPDAEGEV